jgi:hypothetical protein
MQMLTPQTTVRASGKDKLPLDKIAVAVLLIVVVGVLVAWQAPAIGSFLQGNSGSSDEYSQLNLAAGQYVQYAQGNSTYVFSYGLSSADSTGLFYVVMDSQQTRSYPATAGAVYHDLGLEIKVSSVTSNLAVLQVKPAPA